VTHAIVAILAVGALASVALYLPAAAIGTLVALAYAAVARARRD
jgi:hypothetical protein